MSFSPYFYERKVHTSFCASNEHDYWPSIVENNGISNQFTAQKKKTEHREMKNGRKQLSLVVKLKRSLRCIERQELPANGAHDVMLLCAHNINHKNS